MTPTDNLEAGAGDLVAVAWRYRGPRGGWITVDEKPTGWHSEPLHSAAQLAAVTAENARLREAIADLNVTDQELVRIHNMCTGFDGDVKIWAKMLHKLAVFALAARTALSQEAPK